MNRGVSILLVCILGFLHQTLAQGDIPIGTWRAHYNYSDIQLVEEVNNKIFGVGENGLLILDTSNSELTGLTKIDGLSESRITAIAFNEGLNTLVLGYSNGNIDVIREGGITNVPDLKESGIVEVKTIKHISFFENSAYMSTFFGVVVLDMTSNSVKTAYQNLGSEGERIRINSSAFLESELYLATEVGVISADVNSGLLLEDFNNWTRHTGAPFEGDNVVSIVNSNQYVYAADDTNFYGLENDTWTRVNFDLNPGEEIVRIKKSSYGSLDPPQERFMAITSDDLVWFDMMGLDIWQSQRQGFQFGYSINDAAAFWVGTSDRGLVDADGNSYTLNAPVDERIDKLKQMNGAVVAFPKIDENTSSPTSNGLGISIFSFGEWTTIEPSDMKQLDNITDFSHTSKGIFMSSYGSALLQSEDADTTIYDETNSPLEIYRGVPNNILVTGAAQDSRGNIWVTTLSDNSLLTLVEEGNWSSKDFGFSSAREPMSLQISSTDKLWMILGRTSGAGFLGYDPDENLHRLFNSSSANLPSNQVNQLALDFNRDLWLATGNGVAYIPFAESAIRDNTLNAQRPRFNGTNLFEGRNVKSIAVDGGNRKWVGVDNGAWLFDESGSEMIHHFNTENSPLPSNNVLAIAVNHENGEVFISTDNGLISYRSDATRGTGSHQQVKIFPNPVLPNYTGWVGFDGLVKDALLKITTVSGRLVREIQANGGGASWDIKDYMGNRPAMGVYLVFSSDADGNETFVGKIAILE